MALFIGGIHRRRHPVVAVERECAACRRMSIHLGVVAKRALHVFWIPVLPLGSGKRFVCLLCGKEQKVRKITWTNETAIPPSAVRSRLADLNSYYSSLLMGEVGTPPSDAAPGSPAGEIAGEGEEWDGEWERGSDGEAREQSGPSDGSAQP